MMKLTFEQTLEETDTEALADKFQSAAALIRDKGLASARETEFFCIGPCCLKGGGMIKIECSF